MLLDTGDTQALVAYRGTGSRRAMVALLAADIAVWLTAIAMLISYGV